MRTSYPYFQIAKRYNKDYSEVLNLAETINPNSIIPVNPFMLDMLTVSIQHREILQGRRDWLEGYHI